jgi:hypothetical protein
VRYYDLLRAILGCRITTLIATAAFLAGGWSLLVAGAVLPNFLATLLLRGIWLLLRSLPAQLLALLLLSALPAPPGWLTGVILVILPPTLYLLSWLLRLLALPHILLVVAGIVLLAALSPICRPLLLSLGRSGVLAGLLFSLRRACLALLIVLGFVGIGFYL